MREGFRAEIQALRALAVLLVVLFHLWPEELTGGYVGVDVFFVISGYLITSHLWKELAASGRVRLGAFYARRIRRLLPAAFLVLAVALVGVLTLVPRTEWSTMLRDIWASAVYSVNWVLAASSVDYFAAEDAASPVQHYWSLSVEEQFYLVWPLLLMLAWLARRRWVLLGTLGIVLAGSLAYSIVGAYQFQSFAYFATPAHAWEFAAGALLALLLPKAGLRDGRWATVASWAGWTAIVASAFLFDAASPFPGWIALLPVAGTLLVICAGMPRDPWSPSLPVSWRPVQFLGDISYSLYLWHWVPIALLPFALDRSYLTAVEKVAVFAVCILLAWATKVLVEDPARRASFLQAPRRTYLAAAATTVVVVAAAVVPSAIVRAESERNADAVFSAAQAALDGGSPGCIGAAAALGPSDCADSHRLDPALDVPSEAANPTEWAATLADEHPYFAARTSTTDGIEATHYGSEDAPTRVAVIGDSHAGHHLPALLLLGERYDWEITVYAKGACLPAAGMEDLDDADCSAWKPKAIEQVTDGGYDLIVTSGATSNFTRFRGEEVTSGIADGFEQVWREWLDSGSPVLVMTEVPHYRDKVPPCVADEAETDDPCTAPREQVTWSDDPLMTAAAEISDDAFASIDLLPLLCDDELCHPVVGGIVTHRDAGHLSMAFSMTTAPLIERTIRELVPAAVD